MRMQFAQIEELINTAKQMVNGNVIVKVEGVKPRTLVQPADVPSSRKFRSVDG